MDDVAYISEEINQSKSGSIVKAKDILLNITGGSIGRCALVPDNFDIANVNQHVMIIRLVELSFRNYIHNLITSKYIQGQIFSRQIGSGRGGLSAETLSTFLVPVPPLSEQTRIEVKLKQCISTILAVSEGNANIAALLDNTKAKILNLAIRGKLVPQDPNDEPASALLERIRAEKEELIKQGKIKRDKNESVIYKGDDNSYYEKIANYSICIDDGVPFELQSGWEFIRFKGIWQLLSGRDLKPDEYNSEVDGIPYITGASNFANGSVSIVRWTHKPQVISEIGDLLLTCKGTVGEIAVNDFGNAHIARQVMAIRNIYNLNSDYLMLCIKYYLDMLIKNAKGLIPGISREDILNLILPVPPQDYQQKVVVRVKELNALLCNVEHGLS